MEIFLRTTHFRNGKRESVSDCAVDVVKIAGVVMPTDSHCATIPMKQSSLRSLLYWAMWILGGEIKGA